MKKSLFALMCICLLVGCSTKTPPPVAQTATPAAAATATPAAVIDRDIKPMEAIKLTFSIDDKESKVEVPGLAVKVTDHEDDFFRNDFFVTEDALVKVAETRGKKVAFDSETKTLTLGDKEFQQTDVPPLGKGMTGNMAGFGDKGVHTLLQDGKPYFRLSSLTSGFGCNSISKLSDGFYFSGSDK